MVIAVLTVHECVRLCKVLPAFHVLRVSRSSACVLADDKGNGITIRSAIPCSSLVLSWHVCREVCVASEFVL